MELWWRVRGWVRLQLTSADCAERLREFSREIPLVDICFQNELTAAFSVCRSHRERLRVHDGDELTCIGEGGLPAVLEKVGQWKILTAAVMFLFALTLFLPTRILFLRVEGNGDVPARLILERAEECGVYFGASSRELRSEQVKNHLLWAIPELRWAGVNTTGCTAVITVAVRQTEDGPAETVPGDIVADRDCVVTAVFPGAGTVVVSPGQAVKAGQVLISGTTDLGRTVRFDRAQGEVYGLTWRSVESVLPQNQVLRQENGRVIQKFSLLIGKKYVNFFNDSGILHGTCVKMRTVNYLTLPGGFQLPVALVTETYRLCETEAVPRPDGEELLLDAARRYILKHGSAVTVESEDVIVREGRMTARFACREMIGVFRPELLQKGDTNDRENRERGAG